MGIYEFAGCVVSYEPLYGLLRRRMETYRSDTEGQPDITLDGTKEDYEKLRKQYPHLSIEECEYSCAGAEFYMKLLKHQGFMIHASAVEKEGKAYLFSAPSSFGGRRSKENRFGSLTMTSPQFVCKTAYFMHAGLRSAGKPIKMRIAKRRYKDFVCCIE